MSHCAIQLPCRSKNEKNFSSAKVRNVESRDLNSGQNFKTSKYFTRISDCSSIDSFGGKNIPNTHQPLLISFDFIGFITFSNWLKWFAMITNYKFVTLWLSRLLCAWCWCLDLGLRRQELWMNNLEPSITIGTGSITNYRSIAQNVVHFQDSNAFLTWAFVGGACRALTIGAARSTEFSLLCSLLQSLDWWR